MEKNNKKSAILIIVLLVTVMIIGVGGTYAYFQANITQGINSRVSITALNGLTLSFDNGNGFNLQDIMPGAIEEKTISVKLTNKRKFLEEVEYSIIIHVTDNGFNSNTGYLQYKLEGPGENDDTGFKDIKKKSGDLVIASNKKIQGTTTSDDVTDTYTLTMYYPNDENNPQEQGGYFDGYIYITTEHQDGPITFIKSDTDNTVVKKENVTVDNMVVIENERFYIYKIDSTKIYALAQWNIDVGPLKDASGNVIYTPPTIFQGTGLQNENVRGDVFGGDAYGTIDSYHGECIIDRHYKDLQQFGFVPENDYYYANSLLKQYIDDYKGKLLDYGAELVDVTAITSDELVELGCSYSNYSCSNAKEYIVKTAFLTRSSWAMGRCGFDKVYDGYFDTTRSALGSGHMDGDFIGGVRPVIIISKN